ncbi:MAG: hypothetical protein HYT64_02735 [Candidatus Yanofskybacteria bacterium]|nr:hypothetical protein [Candidatus Yanofskybacteria bacterium]
MPENQQQNFQDQLESDRALSQIEKSKQEEENKNQPEEPPKIGTTMFAILLLLCVVADFIDILTIGTIGWLIGFFVDAVLLLSFGLSKGGRKQFKRIVIGVIGDSIPVLAILPFRSFFLVWSFVKSRYELPIQLGLSGLKQTELGK